ncbi:hypothetical protein GCM10010182_44470 [Actinomadura cremea]|nr:hypothetical protein GCM10010182_44470 [Actinomadura cremea]
MGVRRVRGGARPGRQRGPQAARDARLVVLPGLAGQPHLRAPRDFAAALLAFVRDLA